MPSVEAADRSRLLREFGGELKSLMSRAGINQDQLARRTGVSKSTVSEWLSGTRKGPIDWDMVGKIVEVCNSATRERNLMVQDSDKLAEWRTRYSRLHEELRLLTESRSATTQVVGLIPHQSLNYQPRTIDTSAPTTILSGLGGVGKSQLARQVVQDLIDQQVLSYVFWIDAGSIDLVQSQYVQAATQVGAIATGEALSLANGAQRFHSWLTSQERNWLVVLDGLDWSPGASELVPNPGRYGKVIITSRRTDIARPMGAGHVSVLEFGPNESIAYLSDGLPSEAIDNLASLTTLADELGHLPLALGHAATFISETGITCVEYLDRFRDTRRRMRDLFPDPQTFLDKRELTVATTWTVSISAADSLYPVGSAGRILRLASLFDGSHIPLDLLSTPKALTFYSDDFIDQVDLSLGLANLRRYSLVATPGDAVYAHQLVQRAVRESTEISAEIQSIAVSALIESWPTLTDEAALGGVWRANISALNRNLPDLLCASDQGIQAMLIWSRSLLDAGRLNEGSDLAAQILDSCTELLTEEHPHRLTALNNLAIARGQLGDPRRAVGELTYVLSKRTEVLGPEHRLTGETAVEQATWIGEDGDRSYAIEVLDRLLPDLVARFGQLDDLVLRARNAASTFNSDIGRHGPAANHLRELARNAASAFGPRDVRVLDIRANLAIATFNAGNHSLGVMLAESAASDTRSILGEDHPSALSARANFLRLSAQSANVSVERYFEIMHDLDELFQDSSRVLGPKHPRTTSVAIDRILLEATQVTSAKEAKSLLPRIEAALANLRSAPATMDQNAEWILRGQRGFCLLMLGQAIEAREDVIGYYEFAKDNYPEEDPRIEQARFLASRLQTP